MTEWRSAFRRPFHCGQMEKCDSETIPQIDWDWMWNDSNTKEGSDKQQICRIDKKRDRNVIFVTSLIIISWIDKMMRPECFELQIVGLNEISFIELQHRVLL